MSDFLYINRVVATFANWNLREALQLVREDPLNRVIVALKNLLALESTKYFFVQTRFTIPRSVNYNFT